MHSKKTKRISSHLLSQSSVKVRKLSFNHVSVFHSAVEVIKTWTLVTRTALSEWYYYIAPDLLYFLKFLMQFLIIKGGSCYMTWDLTGIFASTTINILQVFFVFLCNYWIIYETFSSQQKQVTSLPFNPNGCLEGSKLCLQVLDL